MVLTDGVAPPKLAEGTRATPIVRTVAWPAVHPCAKEHGALDDSLGGVLQGTRLDRRSIVARSGRCTEHRVVVDWWMWASWRRQTR